MAPSGCSRRSQFRVFLWPPRMMRFGLGKYFFRSMQLMHEREKLCRESMQDTRGPGKDFFDSMQVMHRLKKHFPKSARVTFGFGELFPNSVQILHGPEKVFRGTCRTRLVLKNSFGS